MNMLYRIGIDVGISGVGMAAIEVDESGKPLKILSAVTHLHDSGVDPDNNKSAKTRLAVSGVARRTRRLYAQRKKRLEKLDRFITEQGWPIIDLQKESDPYLPWKIRAELATVKIEDDAVRNAKLSIALRHIARHRGWRNPYQKASSLVVKQAPSDAFEKFRAEVSEKLGVEVSPDTTVPQLLSNFELQGEKLRGDGGLFADGFRQSDFAREIQMIGEVQQLDRSLIKDIILVVFAAKSPKGSAASLAGKDPLRPELNLARALKASDAFQRYRIVSLLANLRIVEDGGQRPLTVEERHKVVNFILGYPPQKNPTWTEIADQLGIDLGLLRGRTSTTDDGERSGSRPPLHDTNRAVLGFTKVKQLQIWWQDADDQARAALINALSNSGVDDFESEGGKKAWDFMSSLSDAEQEALEGLRLPVGRAAYSEDTLVKLTDAMLNKGLDLHQARIECFDAPADWTPPAAPITERTGNPSVDRVLKIVNRWLLAAQREFGTPASINIEHVRAGFQSKKKANDYTELIKDRNRANDKTREEMKNELGLSHEEQVRSSEIRRWLAIQRQNGQCAYCGGPVTFKNSEMDHIVPRAGAGSTNTRDNLVAVCGRCNREKGKIPFAVWAANTSIKGVSVQEAVDRIKSWNRDPQLTAAEFGQLKRAVEARMKRKTIDEEIDARSLESVAWMANELRARIYGWVKEQEPSPTGSTKVRAFRGSITSSARRAAKFNAIKMIGGTGKTRLDRRHHAVDACVIALVTAIPAQVLAERDSLREEAYNRRNNDRSWEEWTGGPQNSHVFKTWLKNMDDLRLLVQQALDNDEIALTKNLRLRLGNGAAHDATVRPLVKAPLSAAFSRDDIHKASNGALFTALTHLEDFDPKKGLPENPNREIVVNGTHYKGDDEITFSPLKSKNPKRDENGRIPLSNCTPNPITEVRGGAAAVTRWHHLRIYKIGNSFGMVRVYVQDLVKQKGDVFSVELPAHSMSIRYALPSTRTAILNGKAEYLGWLVQGDEVVLKPEFVAERVSFLEELAPGTVRWQLTGADRNRLMTLKPLMLAKEGLKSGASEELTKLLGDDGLDLAPSTLFGKAFVACIRRNALGQERWHSNAHLPVSWKV
ncbi:MAG: HNH endonuclease [Corynebacterium sp.]|nr:HNH endonuclease [Corynebacterium sp.]